MNTALEQKLRTLPVSPGVYFHKSKSGEIIYVGKAAILRNRVRQYFQESRLRDNKTTALVREIEDTDWVETESEIDALFLESEMVKRYMPRYNVLLRDDKSQSFVRIDMKSVWPTVTLTRGPLDDGAEYIGPFYNSFALRKALRYLRKIFPYFTREPKSTDSKLEMQIGLNPNIRLGSIAYKASLRQLMGYIRGNRKLIVREIEIEMKLAAESQDYERAAKLRNRIRNLKELQRRVMFGDREFLDISKDAALKDLADILGIDSALKRIEGYDISHMSGSDVVASMVVFTNGTSDRAEYRKFKTTKQTNDDYVNMYDTLRRRFSPRNLQSWGKPDLVLIDGGKGQLEAALRAMEECGVTVPCISIAKREDEIVVHGNRSHLTVNDEASREYYLQKEGEYLIINLHPGQRNASSHSKNLRASAQSHRYDNVVKLFQRIRDEAHRFAISYHTVLRRNRQTKSALDDIPGIGPASRKLLLRKFGSVSAIRTATEVTISGVVGPSKAAKLAAWLRADTQKP